MRSSVLFSVIIFLYNPSNNQQFRNNFINQRYMETVEQFIKEVLIRKHKKDLAPIQHRLGAYLETLFGQVNMQKVLANHLFGYVQK